MRVADIMSRKVKTVTRTEAADKIRQDLRREKIHHLVVMKGGEAVGIISERDLETKAGRNASELMTEHPVVASPHATIREAANLLRGNGVGCLPVIDDGELVGIVTTSDLLELLGRGTIKGQATQRKPMWRRGPRRKPTGIRG